jgi:biotin carboxyl carrier protein
LKKRFIVVLDGEVYEVEVETPEGASPLETVLSVFQSGVVKRVEPPPVGKGIVRAPITGRVSKVAVGRGDRVEKGSTLVLIESMKTVVEVKSDAEGVVEEVYVKEGATVRQGDPLIRLS